LVDFRSFHNADPPRLLQLWHSCALGRCAAEGFACDILEIFTFSQPFFDRKGMILAVDDGRVVGCVHAGFGPNADETGLDRTQGTLAALMVHPGWRRRGIGRELVRRAEDYLRQSGAQNVEAGGGLDKNGFYVGIYGGLQPSGFAADSTPWSEFFQACGYQSGRETIVLSRDLRSSRDPVSARQIRNRRNMKLVISDRPSGHSWWWFVRFGQLDSLTIQLCSNTDEEIVATGQIVGLDVFIPKWGVRSVGVRDIFVPESRRRQGYAMTLLLEICKRFRQESVSLIQAHVDANDATSRGLFESVNFEDEERMLTFTRDLT